MKPNFSLKKIAVLFADKKFYLASFLVCFATFSNFFMSEMIEKWFPFRVPATDLLFTILPYINWTQYITDIAVIFSAIFLFTYINKYDYKHLPYYVMVFAAAYFLRALIIPLTPLGDAFASRVTYGITNIQQHGAFPSGHTAMAAVSYLLVDKLRSPGIKKILLWLLIFEIASLLLSRGHYSIDIVGGLLISYFAFNELKKYKAYFSLKDA